MTLSLKNIDVLCVGNASYDLVFSVSRHPHADEKTIADDFKDCGGGPAANAAVTVARLGKKAAFIGYLGNDIFGQKHFSELRRAGVNTSYIVRGSAATPLSSILVKPNGDRSIVNYNKQSQPLRDVDIAPDVLEKLHPAVILFDGHEPVISPLLADAAREMGIITVLDAGSVFDGTLSLLDRVNYLVCSEKFALDYTGETDKEKALQQLRKHNTNVVITLGGRGLLWQKQENKGVVPAFPVNAIDTTGAGDVFHGAFAACIAAGVDWDVTLRYASAAAALCCTKTGARFGIPTNREVTDFLKRNG
ncbi:carbohydrate kinase [candidate division KSB1 bacterium]|nr:carbohydrate kinase [candidate division KSB1 bacterium]